MADKELQAIVQRMMDAGQSSETIGSVIKAYNERKPAQFNPNPPPLAPTTEPTTFMGGVMKSLYGGDSARASEQGARGYLQGAIGNLPGNLAKLGQSVYEGVSNFDPKSMIIPPWVRGAAELPSMLGSMAETTKQAGAKPFEFGEMMGEITGQPLVTEGIIKAAPSVYRGAGRLTESVGGLMADTQPITGMFPRFLEGRTPRNFEGWVGGRIQDIGRRMATPTLQGEVVSGGGMFERPYKEGQIIQDALPPSNTDFYQGPGGPRRLLTGETIFDSPSPSPMHGGGPFEGMNIPPRQRGNPVTPSSGNIFELPENMPTPTPQLNMQNAPIGQVVTIKQKFVSPDIVKQFKDNGFQFERMNEDGSFRFRKMNDATPREFAPVETKPSPAPIDESGRNLMEAPKTKTVSSTPQSRAAIEATETKKWGDWEDYRMKEVEAGRNDPGMWDGKSTPPNPKIESKTIPSEYFGSTRLAELAKKAREGTLTGEELAEARILDKQLRENKYFNIDVKPDEVLARTYKIHRDARIKAGQTPMSFEEFSKRYRNLVPKS